MMNLEEDISTTIISSFCGRNNAKRTSSGWYSFNAVCCHHNGESFDTRKRGGLKYTSEGGFVYHCFNCGFSSGWKPGNILSNKTKTLFSWMGFTSEEIRRFDMQSWLIRDQSNIINFPQQIYKPLEFEEKKLPAGSRTITEWLQDNQQSKDFLQVVEYMLSRGEILSNPDNYYWTPTSKDGKYFGLNTRLIIPFYWNGKIVGYSARNTTKSSKFRYVSDVQPNYIFNTECIKVTHKYILLVEGPFDALSINGIAVLGDKISNEQINWLKQQHKEIIVVPDRVNEGGKLLDIAIEQKWFVAFPKWGQGIKDCADAVKEYGKLYALWSIMDTKTKNALEINVRKKLSLKS